MDDRALADQEKELLEIDFRAVVLLQLLALADGDRVVQD